MNGEHLTRDEMEARRLVAARLFKAGLAPARIGKLLKVSRTTASRWGVRFRENGAHALKKRIASGRPTRLSEQQRARLKQLCERGPRAAGYDDLDRWTTALLADEIQVRFGIRYDHNHVGRILHRMGVEWRPARRSESGGK